jgi:DNA polymerase III epsilon subunit-like protein
MSEIMLDIETLSTTPNSVILTIGAIKFNRYHEIKDIKDLETFYVRIDQNSCKKLNMDISEGTLSWWNLQPDEYKYEALLNKDRISIYDALKSLTNFIKNCKYIWANSPNFDCTILENAYKLCNLEIPWKFYNLRDTRTVYDLGNINLKSVGETQHHALYDCYNQIVALNKSLKNLKLIKNNSS